MKPFYLVGRAKDVFRELDFMTRLQKATGDTLVRYQVRVQDISQN